MEGCSNNLLCQPILLICFYGFFTNIKPSEPYITPFLMGEQKNFTEEELVNQIYPVWSYSYTAFLVPIFLLTDFLRYKPIIMLQGVGYIGCWVLLITACTVPLMQLMQVFFGLATAAEIGYYSYIYSVVDHKEYQKSTSYVRASTRLGLFIGSLLSQILVSFADVDYLVLNYISLANVSIGFIVSIFLPYPKRSLYFYHQVGLDSPATVDSNPATSDENDPRNNMLKDNDHLTAPENRPAEAGNEADLNDTERNADSNNTSEPLKPNMIQTQWKVVLLNLWKDLKYCYSTPNLMRWSIWWALSTCGWVLVVNYIQNLWEAIRSSEGDEKHTMNGLVEVMAQVLGAAAAFLVGYLTVNWERWGEIILGIGALLESVLLFVMVNTNTLWVCYVAYVCFIASYNFIITIAQFQIAVGMSTERYALIFGVNTFAAIVLNSLLTLILIDDAALGLAVSQQFVIYSGYFLLVALVYFGHGLYALCCAKQGEAVVREDKVQ